MKNTYVLGNWKSNKTMEEAKLWIEGYSANKPVLPENTSVIVCPAFHHLSLFDSHTLGISLGVQDLSLFDTGAYTGEIAASMVKGVVQYAMIGHSERRTKLQETNEQVSKKALQAMAQGIRPVVCVSDMSQVQALHSAIPSYSGLILYEPVGAIGSGAASTPESADAQAREIIKILGPVEVLYGGSVVPENVSRFVSLPNICGVGVGGASLDALKFIQVISSLESH